MDLGLCIPPAMRQIVNQYDIGGGVYAINDLRAQWMGFKSAADFQATTGLSLGMKRSAVASSSEQLLVSMNAMDASGGRKEHKEGQAQEHPASMLNLDIIESNIAYATRVLSPGAESVGSFHLENQESSFVRLAASSELENPQQRTRMA